MKSFKSTAWILPQPVLIIGTYDKNGKPNAMNAAWGGQWDMHEIIISLGSHQTTDNLAENPEFTVTFATTNTMIASDYVGIVSGRNTPDKMEKAGWTVEKARNPLFQSECDRYIVKDEILPKRKSWGQTPCEPELLRNFTPAAISRRG